MTIETERQKQGEPWVEKYRPSTLEDLISHTGKVQFELSKTDIISTITRFIDQNKLPHMLFYGPPGKTSTILACAKRIYGDKYKSCILELNASDDRGIDVVRDQIKSFASSKTMFNTGYKIIILDEADAMTQAAQNALRRVIEKYTRNVRFCIICNYVGKIIPAIQSRCTRFRFAPLKEDQIQKRLEHVVTSEGININLQGRKALLKSSQGDMRRMLNILQACHSAHDIINDDTIYACTGSPMPSDMSNILDLLLNHDSSTAYNRIQALKTEKGLALVDILAELYDYLIDIEFPAKVKINLFEKLAQVEFNLSGGCSEKIQLGGLVGIFRESIDMNV